MYATLTLVIGYLIGHYFAKMIDSILANLKVNEKFEESEIGRSLKRSGYTFSGLIGLISKVFIYILTILTALSFLNIPLTTQINVAITTYLPRAVGSIILFLVGVMIINWVIKLMAGALPETDVLARNWIISGMKYIFYIVLFLMALEITQIAVSVTQILAQSILFTLVIGLGLTFALIIGLGFRDEAKVIFSTDLNILRVNQHIKVAGVEGKIRRFSFLTLELEAGDGRKIVVPKRKLLEEGFEILK